MCWNFKSSPLYSSFSFLLSPAFTCTASFPLINLECGSGAGCYLFSGITSCFSELCSKDSRILEWNYVFFVICHSCLKDIVTVLLIKNISTKKKEQRAQRLWCLEKDDGIIGKCFIFCSFKLMSSLFFKRFYLFIFRQRGRELEREGERYQCVVASRTPPTEVLAHNPGMCLTGKWTSDPLVHRPALNPLSYTRQGIIQIDEFFILYV